DVLQDRLVREQVEGLEHHAHVGAQPGERLALRGQRLTVEGDAAAVDRFQPVDRPAQGGLSRPGRPDHHHHLTAVHGEVDVLQHVQLTEVLVHVTEHHQRLAAGLRDTSTVVGARRTCVVAHRGNLTPNGRIGDEVAITVRTRTGSRLRRLVESAAMTDHQRTYLVRTLGCQMNVHDSERMSGLLEDAGYAPATTRTEKSLVDQAEGADV